jgi:predicted transcriptional regulator
MLRLLNFLHKQEEIAVRIIYNLTRPTVGMARGPDPEIRDVDILKIFVGNQHDPAFVPTEIADELDVTTEGARHQMEKLVERGLLGKKKPGQRTVLYWITPDGYEYYAENASES